MLAPARLCLRRSGLPFPVSRSLSLLFPRHAFQHLREPLGAIPVRIVRVGRGRRTRAISPSRACPVILAPFVLPAVILPGLCGLRRGLGSAAGLPLLGIPRKLALGGRFRPLGLRILIGRGLLLALRL